MIRNIQKISENEISKLIGKKFTLFEKLDMVYFKLHISSEGVNVLKVPTFEKVTDVDILCNDMYKDIMEFGDYLMKTHGEKIIDKYNDIKIGFFYLPAKTTKMISYDSLMEYSYIYSDSTCQDFDFEIISDIVMNKPIINKDVEFTQEMAESACKDPHEFARIVIGGEYTWSGNSVDKIEGLILRFDKCQYQILINDCDVPVDKFSTKIYRDVILNDFSNIILLKEPEFVEKIVNSDMSYIEKICHLFCEYMYLTDIFGRKQIEASDLMPPHNGYLGHMSVNDIPYDTAKIMCKYDERATNVLKIFLYSFCRINNFSKFNKMQAIALEQLNKQILK